MKNYYQTLGVSEDASQEEIKKAYRNLSKKHHPDTSQGDDGKFKEIQEAYSYIGDEQKRKQYDAERRGPQMGPNPFGGGSWSFNFGAGGQATEEDMFEEIFRRFGFDPFEARGRRKKRGADIKLGIRISLEEAFKGKELSVPIKRRENVNGTIREVERTFRLNVRKGFRPGKPIVLKGEGHVGENGGPTGNIVVVPQLRPHGFFIYNGSPHLECTVPIYFTQAVLGDTIYIKHVSGETLQVDIPPLTTHGAVIMLKNKGYPISENAYGDLKIKIKVEMPNELSTEEKKLVEQIHMQSDKKKKEFNFK